MTASWINGMKMAAPFSANIINKIDNYLEATAESEDFSGNVMVSRGRGTGIIRSYGLESQAHWVPNGNDTKFRIGSVTKQFTAAAILQLQAQGLLDVEEPITTYLPGYAKKRKSNRRITVHHLLTHSSGIPEYLNPDIFPDVSEWIRLSTTLDQLIERFEHLPLIFEAGSAFQYSNSGYVLLTKIIEILSGQSYEDYLQVNILEPLGMSNTGYEVPRAVIPNLAQGYLSLGNHTYLQAEPIDMTLPQGAGGLYSTVEDLATWQQWLYGNYPKQTLLSAKAIALLTKPVIAMDLVREGPDAFYGYGLVHDTFQGHPLIHHSGSINGFASSLAYYPDDALTIVVLSNFENTVPNKINQSLASIVFEAACEMSVLTASA